MFALSAADKETAETALFYGRCPFSSADSRLPEDPRGQGPCSAYGSGTPVGSPVWPKFTRARAAAAAVPRAIQEMAVWLHARDTPAAISSRRDLGKLLKCRLEARLSGMGSAGTAVVYFPCRSCQPESLPETQACARACLTVGARSSQPPFRDRCVAWWQQRCGCGWTVRVRMDGAGPRLRELVLFQGHGTHHSSDLGAARRSGTVIHDRTTRGRTPTALGPDDPTKNAAGGHGSRRPSRPRNLRPFFRDRYRT